MRAIFHRRFEKHFAKLPERIKDKFEVQLEIFYQDPFDSRLDNHELNGKYKGHRSVNVTGDFRAIYITKTEGVSIFVEIGSHSELYS